MLKDIKTNMPDEITKNMMFERHIFSTKNTQVVISTFSEHDESSHVLRIYQLMYNDFTNTYDFVQELEAFSFQSNEELIQFLGELPQLNGIEMLLLTNPIPI